MGFFMQVLTSGTYATPHSPCNICKYDVQFVAPAVKCENITQATDFSRTLPVFSDSTTVWNGSFQDPLDSFPIASRNILVEGTYSHRGDLAPADQ